MSKSMVQIDWESLNTLRRVAIAHHKMALRLFLLQDQEDESVKTELDAVYHSIGVAARALSIEDASTSILDQQEEKGDS